MGRWGCDRGCGPEREGFALPFSFAATSQPAKTPCATATALPICTMAGRNQLLAYDEFRRLSAPREPFFNMPASVAAIVALLVAVHLVRAALPVDLDDRVIWSFGFVPLRYETTLLPGPLIPGGWGALVWSFVTYALLHGDLTHLGFNVLWLLPFGAAVARRFGASRFLLFLAICAIGGALAHLLPMPASGRR